MKVKSKVQLPKIASFCLFSFQFVFQFCNLFRHIFSSLPNFVEPKLQAHEGNEENYFILLFTVRSASNSDTSVINNLNNCNDALLNNSRIVSCLSSETKNI